jgi:hypothetical protein
VAERFASELAGSPREALRGAAVDAGPGQRLENVSLDKSIAERQSFQPVILIGFDASPY